MSGSSLFDREYVVDGVLFVIYLALRLKVIPRIGGLRNSRIFLLVFLCGAISLNIGIHYRRVPLWYSRDKVLYAETLRNLSQVLPEGTRVGYISDIKRSDTVAWLVRYFSTQYAVAPRVLEDGTAPNWLIVNAVTYDRHLIPDGMVLVRDFGEGVMLFRREKE
jgi:hypothetical protein